MKDLISERTVDVVSGSVLNESLENGKFYRYISDISIDKIREMEIPS